MFWSLLQQTTTDPDPGPGIALLLVAMGLFGAFGGVLYGIRNQQFIWCHRSGEHSWHPGCLGDAAYGAAGAFVIFIIMPGSFDVDGDMQWVRFLAVALVGGYGGRALIDRALAETITGRRERQKRVEIDLDQIRRQSDRDALALSLVERQLSHGDGDFPAPSEEELRQAVSEASPSARVKIFEAARDVRTAHWRPDGDKVLLERTIPVFQGLIEADRELRFHRNFGQLGYAYKDRAEPDWAEAEKYLSRAIEVRDKGGKQGFLLYELNRALCRMHLDEAFARGEPTPASVKEAVLSDIRKAKHIEHGAWQVFETEEFAREWLERNGVDLEAL